MHLIRNILTLIIFTNIVFASKPIIIKLATVAPEGTEYYNLLFEMGQRWQQETSGQIHLRIYPNGVVGGERDTIRKMRVGQIQASAMSSIGLAELTDQIQAFTLPMGFKNYEEIDRVKLADEVNKITTEYDASIRQEKPGDRSSELLKRDIGKRKKGE